MRLPVPGYVWELLAPHTDLIAWTKLHVARVARRYPAVRLQDLWDESLTALIRAKVFFDAERATPGNVPGKSTPFGRYATTAVHRACWRHGVRGTVGKPGVVSYEAWAAVLDAREDEDVEPCPEGFVVPGPETIVLALETCRNRIPDKESTHGKRDRRVQAGS